MKLKRIFALLGAVLLAGLFILAIVLAVMGAPKNYLMAVIFSPGVHSHRNVRHGSYDQGAETIRSPEGMDEDGDAGDEL